MTGTLIETFPRPTRFARNCGTQSMPSPTVRSCGRVTDAMPDGTSFRAFRSAWCTGCVAMKSRSSPLLTAGDGQATGGLDYERPSNFRMQRSALRAAADAERSTHGHCLNEGTIVYTLVRCGSTGTRQRREQISRTTGSASLRQSRCWMTTLR